ASSRVCALTVPQFCRPLKTMQTSQRYLSPLKVVTTMAPITATTKSTAIHWVFFTARLSEEVAHLAEFRVPMLDERFGREAVESREAHGQRFAEQLGGAVPILVRALAGFRDDAIDQAEGGEVFGGEAQGGGGLLGLAGIAVDDGGAAFGR